MLSSRKSLFATLFTAGLLLVMASDAEAQIRRVPRYAPQTPTTSPYLSLVRGGGSASNYYTLVRPLQQQADTLRLQQQRLELEARRLDQYQLETERQGVRPTGTAGWFNRGTARSVYGETGHYYESWRTRPNMQYGRIQ